MDLFVLAKYFRQKPDARKNSLAIFSARIFGEIGFYIQYILLIDTIATVYIRTELKGQKERAGHEISSNGTKAAGNHFNCMRS